MYQDEEEDEEQFDLLAAVNTIGGDGRTKTTRMTVVVIRMETKENKEELLDISAVVLFIS